MHGQTALAVTDLLAGFCGGVLIYAAIAKIGQLDAFSTSLLWLAGRPSVAWILARVVIGLEAVFGVGLFLPFLRTETATAAMALMAIFSAALAVARARGLQGSCMCFGDNPEPITVALIARDIALVVALWLVSFGGHEGSVYLTWAGLGTFLLLLLLNSLRTSLGWIRKEA